jgi:hypothetical protein
MLICYICVIFNHPVLLYTKTTTFYIRGKNDQKHENVICYSFVLFLTQCSDNVVTQQFALM